MVGTRAGKGKPDETPQDSGIVSSAPIVLGPPASPSEDQRPGASASVPAHLEPALTITDSVPRPTRAPSTTSRSSATSTARRKREAELAAAEELARIELETARKCADIERDMLQKRLQAQLADIEEEEAEDDDRPPDFDDVTRRTTQWVDETEPRRPHVDRTPTRRTARADCTPITEHPGSSNGTEMAQLVRAISALATRPDRHAAKLPEFSGGTREFLSFKAAYEEQRHRFTPIENLARLRRGLTGEAKAAVAYQLIGKGDPEKVMVALQKRFGRPEHIVDDELQALKEMPRLTDVPRQINVFASKLENTVAALQALEEDKYLRSTDVVRAIKDKIAPMMPEWTIYARGRRDDDTPELVKLSEFLSERADDYAYACRVEKQDRPAPAARAPAPTSRARATDQPRTLRPSRTHTTATTSASRASTTCLKCNSADHTLATCAKFKQLESDARWEFVRGAGVCFRCLRTGHRSAVCSGKKSCTVPACGRRHHTLLHYMTSPQPTTTPRRTGATEETPPEVVASAGAGSARALLKIVPVTIYGPTTSVTTFALLDDGSTISLVKSELARRAGLSGRREPLTISGITGASIATDSQRVTFSLSGPSGHRHVLRDAQTMDDLQLTTQTVDDVSCYQHLADLPIQPYTDARPEILIGQDNWHLLLSYELRQGRRDEPAASRTPLGWVLHGGHGGSRSAVHFVGHSSEADSSLEEAVKQHYRLEALGVSPIERRHPDDERALDILKRTCTRTEDDNRWQAGLLWREDTTIMPPSSNSATRRLRPLEKKMDADRDFGEAYAAQMQRLFDAGYATPAGPTTSKKRWLLPHFAVLNPNKPGKIRIVFDAAARVDGRSLNDALITGPDLLQSLLGVLFRFREGKIAVAADVREMFLRIKVAPDDRPAQRFLWRGWDRLNPPTEYEMSSLIFGAASSPTTAIYVKNRNAEDFCQLFPEAARAIERSFYMDDFLESFDSESDATRVAKDVAYVNRQGGFQLAGWASNSDDVLRSIDSEQPNKMRDLNLQVQLEKTLGLRWNPIDDTLGFNINDERTSENDAARLTKRRMLSVTMSVFDPLGLLAPITIQAKVLLQQLWRSGVTWDDEIDGRHAEQWREWLQRLRDSWTCRVPRCYCPDADTTNIELHTFCDASEDAYAAVSYFRFVAPSGDVHITLVSSKSRVTPLKPVSIPRLELQAALLGARLATTIKKEHRLQPYRCVYWTDSRTVLMWLQGDPRSYKPFVSHRLGEIDELTVISDWRWVPTLDNVADDATRALPMLNAEHRWFRGPAFLRRPEDEWPARPSTSTSASTPAAAPATRATGAIAPATSAAAPAAAAPCDDGDIELRTSRRQGEVATTATVPAVPAARAPHLPDAARFSRWTRLVRATACVLLFIDKCRRRHDGDMQRRHLDRAEQLLLKQSQSDAFATELRCLRSGRPLPSNSRLQHLSPHLDAGGVLRLRGRADATPGVGRATTQPIILCGRHRVVRLLVLHHHIMAHHGSPETVVNILRTAYWVVHLRPTVRAVASACQTCRLRTATALTPPMGDLPEARLGHHHRAFTYCGVDYFGPIAVAVGRRREKRYGALFTCLVTRAVHLEVAASLTTDSAISALRRLIARRGAPAVIYSDNGTNFHGADNELRRAWAEVDQEAVRTFALTRGADWRFIPPAAPFMGGAWERLVGSVRRALRVTLHERAPTDEVLATLLAEAEHTINSRPLTHVSVDPRDPEALTPNHFLLGSASGAPTAGAFDDGDLIRTRSWRAAQRLADHFWARWLREYLPTLLPRRLPGDRRPELRVGDLVIIVDPALPRNVWPRGVIERELPGRDGHVRVVDVRTAGGLLRRPTRRLVRLPVQEVVEPASTTGGRMLTTDTRAGT